MSTPRYEIADVSISGFLVGDIWMPATECYKPLHYSLTDRAHHYPDGGTLRDHVLRVCQDGDFQSASIADGELIVTVHRHDDRGTYRRTRRFPLSKFPSVADCVRTDWDGPVWED